MYTDVTRLVQALLQQVRQTQQAVQMTTQAALQRQREREELQRRLEAAPALRPGATTPVGLATQAVAERAPQILASLRACDCAQLQAELARTQRATALLQENLRRCQMGQPLLPMPTDL